MVSTGCVLWPISTLSLYQLHLNAMAAKQVLQRTLSKPLLTVSTSSRTIPPLVKGRQASDDDLDLCTDEQKTPPPSPSKKRKLLHQSTDLQAEIDLLREAYLTSRHSSSRSNGPNYKHTYFASTAATVLDGTNFVALPLTQIAAGTGFGQRVGVAVSTHSITSRGIFRYIPQSNGATSSNWIPPAIRILIYRSVLPPNQAPLIADVIEYTTLVCTSNAALLTSNAGASPGGNITAVRNLLTFDRFHVYYDKVISFPSSVWYDAGQVPDSPNLCIGIYPRF